MDIVELCCKLTINNKILKKQFKSHKKSKICKNNTIIFIDWDDTLFPTSRMHKLSISKERYAEIDESVCAFLDKAEELGEIYIVTNAKKSWINKTAVHLQNTQEKLKYIRIISAREKYKKKYEIMSWKKHAFRQIIKSKRSFLMNIISIGDSKYEHYALLSLLYIQDLNRIKYLKSFRISEEPTCGKLIDQLYHLRKNIKKYVMNKNHIDKTI